MSNEKITICLDCDDTILYSSEAVIRILNKKYKINKTINDLTDWYYKSIVPEITQEEILSIYDSEEFWNEVELNQEFVHIFEKLKNNFNWIIVSRGRKENIDLKRQFVAERLGVPMIGLLITKSEESCASKKEIDMSGNIQVDDNMGCLEGSNAAVKILLTHGRDFAWNNPTPNEDNLYVAQNWKEIGESLEFFLKYPSMVGNCYGE